jgi:type III secretory pathway component EscU
LSLCQQIAKICLRHFDDVIKGRAVFILIELLEHANTKKMVLKQLKAQKADIKQAAKEQPNASGLQILMKKLSE